MQHNKLYLSVAQSRAWGSEWPVGDPFSGPAFGQRNMPVVAVLGAAMSVSAGVGMLGTAVLGSTMLGTIIGGAMIAGGVMTTVGTITGNEKLASWGGKLSLIGGIAGMAAGVTRSITDAAGKTLSSTAVMDRGMAKISDAWGQVSSGNFSGALNSLGPNGGIQAAAPINEASAQLVNQAGIGSGNVKAPVTAPVNTAPASVDAAGNGLTDFKPDYSVPAPTSLSSNPTGATQSLSGASGAKPGGILSFMDGMSGTEKLMAGQMLSQAATGVSSYLSGKDEQKALEAIRAGNIEMASNTPLIIDPNSPNRAEWERIAKERGINTISFGVNPNAAALQQTNVYSNPTLAQYQPGGQVAAPRPWVPQAPGILATA